MRGITKNIHTEDAGGIAAGHNIYSIVNLRIEEVRLSSRTVLTLASWIRARDYLITFGLMKVKFEMKGDFKILMEAI